MTKSFSFLYESIHAVSTDSAGGTVTEQTMTEGLRTRTVPDRFQVLLQQVAERVLSVFVKGTRKHISLPVYDRTAEHPTTTVRKRTLETVGAVSLTYIT